MLLEPATQLWSSKYYFENNLFKNETNNHIFDERLFVHNYN